MDIVRARNQHIRICLCLCLPLPFLAFSFAFALFVCFWFSFCKTSCVFVYFCASEIWHVILCLCASVRLILLSMTRPNVCVPPLGIHSRFKNQRAEHVRFFIEKWIHAMQCPLASCSDHIVLSRHWTTALSRVLLASSPCSSALPIAVVIALKGFPLILSHADICGLHLIM